MAVLPSGSTPFGALRPRSPSRWGHRLLPFLARWDALALPVASVSIFVSKARQLLYALICVVKNRIKHRIKNWPQARQKSDTQSDTQLDTQPRENWIHSPEKLDTRSRKLDTLCCRTRCPRTFSWARLFAAKWPRRATATREKSPYHSYFTSPTTAAFGETRHSYIW